MLPKARGKEKLWDSSPIKLNVIYDKVKHQVLIFEILEPADTWHFCFKKRD